MKINKLWIALIVIAIFSVSLLTCVDQTVKYQQDAILLTIKIGNVEVETVPKPITDTQWNSETYSLAGADFARASFNTVADTTEQRIRVTVNEGSRAEWGIATRGTKPGSFNDMRVPITFADQDYIYIKVDSNDNQTTVYYRVYTRLKSFVTDLNQISIDGRVGKAKGGEPEWNKVELEASEISITVDESLSATIEAVTYDPEATVKYAAVRKGSGATPVFTGPETPLALQDQDDLYVEVTAENTYTKEYFKFLVNVGRMATVKTLKFGSGDKQLEVYGKGLPGSAWNTVTQGTFQTAKNDQPNGGFNIIIELDDPKAALSYVKYLEADTGDPAFGTTNPGKIEFATQDSLAIKVVAPVADNDGEPIVLYYRVRVTLLAGNIIQQPKSTWYYTGDTAAPLSVELSPADTGQYDYVWYEADSWYGIYGRHGQGVDEKANVSCVNGGPGQYFYLVQPDEIPRGGLNNTPYADEPLAWTVGTNKTYTPKTTWRNGPPPGVTANTKPPYPGTKTSVLSEAIAAGYNPAQDECYYLQGGTTETRYYWVKVTDKNTGLTVTSDRAVIMTESDRSMDHFVFDLALLPTRKNLVPFTKKNEVFEIDLTNYPFPENFDPSKYQICIAHAQYFLPDGRPWTQNWTHGDLHFGYTEGSESFRKNGGPLTWWHNNMGANSGSIPLQAPRKGRLGIQARLDRFCSFRRPRERVTSQ